VKNTPPLFCPFPFPGQSSRVYYKGDRQTGREIGRQ
jgi:hypothetical protein